MLGKYWFRISAIRQIIDELITMTRVRFRCTRAQEL
jgi:hypothetical protein